MNSALNKAAMLAGTLSLALSTAALADDQAVHANDFDDTAGTANQCVLTTGGWEGSTYGGPYHSTLIVSRRIYSARDCFNLSNTLINEGHADGFLVTAMNGMRAVATFSCQGVYEGDLNEYDHHSGSKNLNITGVECKLR